jgi:hypothetical protein
VNWQQEVKVQHVLAASSGSRGRNRRTSNWGPVLCRSCDPSFDPVIGLSGWPGRCPGRLPAVIEGWPGLPGRLAGIVAPQPTALVPDGHITVEGPFFDNGTNTTLAITGGTGKYAGAEGSMLLHATGHPAGSEFDFIFQLTH